MIIHCNINIFLCLFEAKQLVCPFENYLSVSPPVPSWDLALSGSQTLWRWDLLLPLQMCLAAFVPILGLMDPVGSRLGTSAGYFLTLRWAGLCWLLSRCELILGKNSKFWEPRSSFAGDSPMVQGVRLPCHALGLRVAYLCGMPMDHFQLNHHLTLCCIYVPDYYFWVWFFLLWSV